jgi:DNA polymerase (family X)
MLQTNSARSGPASVARRYFDGPRRRYGVAVEINAHPWRLDLDWRWHQAALDFGCMMSINPDAHLIRELDHMHWGVEMARKGGVPPDRVLNAMPLPQIIQYLRRRRRETARAA